MLRENKERQNSFHSALYEKIPESHILKQIDKVRFKSALRGVYFIPNILGGLIVGYIFSFIFTYIIPADVYEAATIDGSGAFYTFRKITLPLLMPFISINLVLSTKNMLMVFDQIMSLTKGGPAQSTESISYLIYRNGMDGGQFGFQSANAVLFFVLIVTISVIQMKITGKKEEQL